VPCRRSGRQTAAVLLTRSQVDPAVAQCFGIAGRGLSDHFLRVIHSGDGSGVKALQQQLDRDTRPKTNLQDLVVGANVEQLDDLRGCIPVRARHDHST
jgi:hypothetical protein